MLGSNKNGKEFYVLLFPMLETLYQDYNNIKDSKFVYKENKLHQVCDLGKQYPELNIICMEDDFINYRKTNDKEFLYYKTDHHMTDFAAYMTYEKFLNILNNNNYNLKITPKSEFTIFVNKLCRYDFNRVFDEGRSYVKSNVNDKSLLDTQYLYYDYKKLNQIEVTGQHPHLKHFNRNGKYSLLIIGTSFQESLSYFLNTSFKNIDKYRFNNRVYPLRKCVYEDIIKHSDSDIVVLISHSPDLKRLLDYNKNKGEE